MSPLVPGNIRDTDLWVYASSNAPDEEPIEKRAEEAGLSLTEALFVLGERSFSDGFLLEESKRRMECWEIEWRDITLNDAYIRGLMVDGIERGVLRVYPDMRYYYDSSEWVSAVSATFEKLRNEFISSPYFFASRLGQGLGRSLFQKGRLTQSEESERAVHMMQVEQYLCMYYRLLEYVVGDDDLEEMFVFGFWTEIDELLALSSGCHAQE